MPDWPQENAKITKKIYLFALYVLFCGKVALS